MTEVFKSICKKLDEAGVDYDTRHHADNAHPEVEFGMCTVADIPIPYGAKAIVVKGKKSGELFHFVLPDDCKVDNKKVQRILGERWSFAGVEELIAATGCVPGSVPPFGSTIGLKTRVDQRLSENKQIVFNAGSLTDSICLTYDNYAAVESPEVVDIAKEDE